MALNLKDGLKWVKDQVGNGLSEGAELIVGLGEAALQLGGKAQDVFSDWVTDEVSGFLGTLGGKDDSAYVAGGGGASCTTNVNIDLSAKTNATVFQLEGTQDGTFLVNNLNGRVWKFDSAKNVFQITSRKNNQLLYQKGVIHFDKYKAVADAVITQKVLLVPPPKRPALQKSLEAKYITPFKIELDQLKP